MIFNHPKMFDIPMSGKRYDIIYADPAWNYNSAGFADQARRYSKFRSAASVYHVMTPDELTALPVNLIASDNCALFCWTTDTHIPECINLCENHWGFKFKTKAFEWVKQTKHGKWHIGLGHWTRANSESCFMFTKGSPKRDENGKGVRRLVVDKIREHSRKPDRIRDDILTLMGDKPRIELFARTAAPGWDAWGNEVGKF